VGEGYRNLLLPANIVLRNFDLTLFLAAVGINSGQAFVTTVGQTGPLMLLDRCRRLADNGRDCPSGRILRAAQTRFPVAPEATPRRSSNCATSMAPTGRPDIGYAVIFRSTTIVKVIAMQVGGLVMVGSRSPDDQFNREVAAGIRRKFKPPSLAQEVRGFPASAPTPTGRHPSRDGFRPPSTHCDMRRATARARQMPARRARQFRGS